MEARVRGEERACQYSTVAPACCDPPPNSRSRCRLHTSGKKVPKLTAPSLACYSCGTMKLRLETYLADESPEPMSLEPRPREKLTRLGAQSLSDPELLAILMGSGS